MENESFLNPGAIVVVIVW